MRVLNFKWIFIVLILTVFFHFTILFFVPKGIFKILKYKIEDTAGGKNKFNFNPLVYAGNDKVVATNPDMLYASISYDVSKNPIKVSFHQTNMGNYWSASLFEGKTGANIFTLNDLDIKTNSKNEVYSLVIKSVGTNYTQQPNEKVVNIKIPQGVLLYRMVLPNRSNKTQVDSLIAIQKMAAVKILN